MEHHQHQQRPRSQSRRSPAWKTALFVSASIVALAIAFLWAMGDIGWMPTSVGKLALIFFSWVVLETALYQVFFHDRRED